PGRIQKAEDIFQTQNGVIVPVAVKSLRLVTTDKDQRLPWISEVEMTHQLNHPNIVRFFGFCMEPADSNVLMVFEMMDKGALDSFCRKINYQMSINETVDWLCQIARGMAHLHSQVPAIVHGDLAARNVLVCSHPVDVTRFKWLPPEVLRSREMTPKADVWSYGVLIHELYGIGEPYGMMGPEKVIHALNGRSCVKTCSVEAVAKTNTEIIRNILYELSLI
ncbi:protein tyrosine kinase, partial [Teladorsagia circumcincta]